MRKIMILLTVLLTLLGSTLLASAAPAAITADPAVVIVNPSNQSVVYSDSLLISIKVTEPRTLRVQVSEIKQMLNGTPAAIDVAALIKMSENNTTTAGISIKDKKIVSACDMEKFVCTNKLTFVTKQVNNLSPGLYVVQVDTLDAAGKVLYSSQSQVAIMGKVAVEDQAKIFDTPQNGALQFFQNLLKNIFK